jgi:hypothetical protein
MATSRSKEWSSLAAHGSPPSALSLRFALISAPRNGWISSLKTKMGRFVCLQREGKLFKSPTLSSRVQLGREEIRAPSLVDLGGECQSQRCAVTLRAQ